MGVLEYILEARAAKRHLLAILLDPEKTPPANLASRTLTADLIFVGGSTGNDSQSLVSALKQQTDKPVILFPGNPQQITPQADALLFLSLLSSRNPDMLIGQQVKAAMEVKRSGIETISMGYILLDGGIRSSVELTTRSQPIPQTDIEKIVSTAVAARLLGMQTVYLEAGSGAEQRVSKEVIQTVRENIDIPLIVGGGIHTQEQMMTAFSVGADIVVIGNHFEQHPEDIPLFTERPV